MRVALAFAVAASLLAVPACGGDDDPVPEPPVTGVVTVTMTEDGCEFAGPEALPDDRLTLETVKQIDGEGSFQLLRLKPHVTYADLESHIEREHERRASGQQTVGYQSLASLEASTELLEADGQAVIAPQPNDLQPGTHAVLCIQPSQLDLAGPLVLTP
jgi:hypothetical protein